MDNKLINKMENNNIKLIESLKDEINEAKRDAYIANMNAKTAMYIALSSCLFGVIAIVVSVVLYFM